MHKATQFNEAADMIRELADEHEDIADAYVTLCVHAGIAASDVICCARLGEHAQGENHDEAISLLSRADKEIAKHLRTLLKLKTKAGYSHTPATVDEFKRAGRRWSKKLAGWPPHAEATRLGPLGAYGET
ncbi:hypothetical protein [Amycolatopsis keratiniphila]|uniref:HEPN domain-containing protein n=1 Tax=Amycolatopsis keratiniphila subsp. keratiniphila TaxID=227715 RepID=A0A1W2LSU8_9PSEU|nr:hypothetical protein [Amycolatopsis keratiniphila]ONF67930.1 hypothetical protein AVR91_0221055 [Amycolatopsis keratiniphila subsp. keratiniphila]